MTQPLHRVVIVGGGAGGLELAANLGRRYGPRHVFLVDKDDTHIWKPSLHEVAAGTLDIHREGLSYFMLAKDCGFSFVHGALQSLDRAGKHITIGPVHADTGDEVLPERVLAYDTLVMAVGSKSNFFGTPGAAQYATALDSTEQAEHFRLKLLHALSMANRNKAMGEGKPINIAIVGGGATGVELAAELLEAYASFTYYGLDQLDPGHDCHIALLEGADRILSNLPPKMSTAARSLLEERGVTVYTSVRVAAVEEKHLIDSEGGRYPADLCVWAAGIQAPLFLTGLGLETNRIQQLVVDAQLRTQDADIFAIGDCAQAPWLGQEGYLPARAQVAHQQASFMLKLIKSRIAGQPEPDTVFKFKDYGSLVSVGHSRGVGSLMGVLSGKSWFVEGLLARFMYMSLHLLHHKAVLGPVRTASLALGRLLMKRGAPRVKLH
ncbi:NAD(P)/FAD-dependent oxidoreductase [Alcaligenaceae bacterium]|nr:NAD(P)/FAD-dependent oxidoreductase [Alcaligenaceae bacterium]